MNSSAVAPRKKPKKPSKVNAAPDVKEGVPEVGEIDELSQAVVNEELDALDDAINAADQEQQRQLAQQRMQAAIVSAPPGGVALEEEGVAGVVDVTPSAPELEGVPVVAQPAAAADVKSVEHNKEGELNQSHQKVVEGNVAVVGALAPSAPPLSALPPAAEPSAVAAAMANAQLAEQKRGIDQKQQEKTYNKLLLDYRNLLNEAIVVSSTTHGSDEQSLYNEFKKIIVEIFALACQNHQQSIDWLYEILRKPYPLFSSGTYNAEQLNSQIKQFILYQFMQPQNILLIRKEQLLNLPHNAKINIFEIFKILAVENYQDTLKKLREYWDENYRKSNSIDLIKQLLDVANFIIDLPDVDLNNIYNYAMNVWDYMKDINARHYVIKTLQKLSNKGHQLSRSRVLDARYSQVWRCQLDEIKTDRSWTGSGGGFEWQSKRAALLQGSEIKSPELRDLALYNYHLPSLLDVASVEKDPNLKLIFYTMIEIISSGMSDEKYNIDIPKNTFFTSYDVIRDAQNFLLVKTNFKELQQEVKSTDPIALIMAAADKATPAIRKHILDSLWQMVTSPYHEEKSFRNMYRHLWNRKIDPIPELKQWASNNQFSEWNNQRLYDQFSNLPPGIAALAMHHFSYKIDDAWYKDMLIKTIQAKNWKLASFLLNQSDFPRGKDRSDFVYQTLCKAIANKEVDVSESLHPYVSALKLSPDQLPEHLAYGQVMQNPHDAKASAVYQRLMTDMKSPAAAPVDSKKAALQYVLDGYASKKNHRRYFLNACRMVLLTKNDPARFDEKIFPNPMQVDFYKNLKVWVMQSVNRGKGHPADVKKLMNLKLSDQIPEGDLFFYVYHFYNTQKNKFSPAQIRKELVDPLLAAIKNEQSAQADVKSALVTANMTAVADVKAFGSGNGPGAAAAAPSAPDISTTLESSQLKSPVLMLPVTDLAHVEEAFKGEQKAIDTVRSQIHEIYLKDQKLDKAFALCQFILNQCYQKTSTCLLHVALAGLVQIAHHGDPNYRDLIIGEYHQYVEHKERLLGELRKSGMPGAKLFDGSLNEHVARVEVGLNQLEQSLRRFVDTPVLK